jgi:ketosteroid isomerase-like protein
VQAPAGHARRLEERLAVRFPAAIAAINRTWQRLPPRSSVRRKVVRRLTTSSVAAANRRDYESAFALFDPDCEMNPPSHMVGLGTFPVSLHSRSERLRLEEGWREDWGEFRYEPEEVLDLEDRVLILGRMVGTGAGSGAAFDHEWADLVTFAKGRIIREQVFFSRAEALEAAGLSE